MKLDWNHIETKWQAAWAKQKLFEAEPDPSRRKCFVTYPFPYMNGPLHVGNAYTAARIDAYARYMRMKGYNVLFPWAWHWTGKTVAGIAERVKLNDPTIIRGLRDVDGVPEEDVRKFVDPTYMAKYYTDYNREAIKRFGLAIDWRREFHTSSLHPQFSKFVEWQYLKLHELGYVVIGTHPVVWCPNDQSPTGDADRLEGVDVRPEEYVLVKFRFKDKLGEKILPCATLRPETVYGVTNIWVHPDGVYVEASVNNETWIVSKNAAEKLTNQLKQVVVKQELPGRELVGLRCVDPVAGRSIPILPGWFVDLDNATGLVYSVPAHAPYDWLALRDLQREPDLVKTFGITDLDLKTVVPISIISLEGFGEFPAVEIVDRLGVHDQHDPKATDATREIYKAEFHTGVLKDNCGPFAGKRVADVKQQLISEFRAKAVADYMYELPQPVVCRCTTRCFVKVLEDQWFLKYSDPEWKANVRGAISKTTFYPEEARNWFLSVVEWLQDWACARRTGLGTPLPWKPDWIVETLSDSTIYMAFYTIAKHIKQHSVNAEQLSKEVFDYVFLGIGDPNQTATTSGIKSTTLREMREEFLYWYPVDLRNSGKDLVGNHFTFFIFHHVAIFPPQHWPRMIGVNGFLTVEGEAMHKSKGNFIPLRKAVEEYGADPTRCTLLMAAEGMDDPDWRWENLREIKSRLESLHALIEQAKLAGSSSLMSTVDRWLISVVQSQGETVGAALESLRTRTALSTALYGVWNDYRWYLRRTANPNPKVVRELFEAWIRLLAPFAPHLAEELWQAVGNKGFVTTASWPQFEPEKSDVAAEEAEAFIRSTLDDTMEIIHTTRITPRKVVLYAPADWKWNVYTKILEMVERGETDQGAVIRNLMQDSEVRKLGERVTKFVAKTCKDILTAPKDRRKRLSAVGKADDLSVLNGARDFFARELKAEVLVFTEDAKDLYDPKGRASQAEPYRAGIYVE